MPAERRVEFMRLQNRRPRLPPDLPVDLCGQRPSIVRTNIASSGWRSRRMVSSFRIAVTCGRREHAVGRPRDPNPSRGALVPEGGPGAGWRYGGQEAPQNEATLRLFGGSVQDREALPIGKMKRSFAKNCGHVQAPWSEV